MTDNTRIYAVKELDDDGKFAADHLVRAGSQAQAIRALVANRFTADVAGQDQLVELLSAGVKVREATA